MFVFKGYRYLFISTLFVMTMAITGCGGSSSPAAAPNWIDDAVSVSASINLPVDAPVNLKTLEVAVMDREFYPDEIGNLDIKTPEKTPSDAYIMLAPKIAGGDPVIYLFATIFPGELNPEISVESTAVGLVMSSIPRHFLDNAGSPQQVKDVVLLHAEPFITKFSTMIASNPYVLEYGNLSNVYDQTYKNSVTATYEALKLLLQNNVVVPKPSYTTKKYLKTNELGGQFIVKPEAEQDGFKIVAEFKDGKMTGNLLVQNDTRLYAHFRVTTVLNDPIKDFPKGFVNSAFSPEILGSQAGIWGGFISTEQRVETKFKNVTVDIETAGTLDIGPDYYNTSGPGLMARTTFANFILPVVDIVLPVSDLGHAVFSVLAESNVFDDAVMQAWRTGDVSNGIKVIAGNIKSATLQKVIEKSFEYSLTKGRLARMLATLTVKLAAVEIMGSITAIDLKTVQDDLQGTHAQLRFNVVFPISLDYISTNTVDKESVEPTKISLHGTGFQAFTYENVEYSPELHLTAIDKDGNEITSATLGVPDIVVNSEGTEIDFYIPRIWLGQDDSLIKNVDVVDVKLHHHYIQPGLLFNSLEYVEIPLTVEDQLNYRIDLTSGLMISNLSRATVQGGDQIEVTGSGFAEEGVLNEVYLVIRNGVKNLMTVDYVNVDGTLLKATVPSHEELVLIGPAYIHVELEDGTESNKLPVTVIPEDIVAEPNSTAFDSPILVTLTSPQAFSFIAYSTDGWLTEDIYNAPITINDTTTLFARARSSIEGVIYDSDVTVFEYAKCADDQMLVNGECVKPCAYVCNAPTISNVITIPGYYLDADGNNPVVHNITMTFDNTYKWCTNTINDESFENGEKRMLYLYKNFRNEDGSWNDTYIWPNYGDRNFIHGSMSIDVPYERLYTKLFPLVEYYTQTFNFEPETIFAMALMNYDNSDPDNGNDYMRVTLGILIGEDITRYYYTDINPEIIGADGCYEGDY